MRVRRDTPESIHSARIVEPPSHRSTTLREGVLVAGIAPRVPSVPYAGDVTSESIKEDELPPNEISIEPKEELKSAIEAEVVLPNLSPIRSALAQTRAQCHANPSKSYSAEELFNLMVHLEKLLP